MDGAARAGLAKRIPVKNHCPMQARIYFLLIIITSVVIVTIKDKAINTLKQENNALRKSLHATEEARESKKRSPLPDPLSVSSGAVPLASESTMAFGNDLIKRNERIDEKINAIKDQLKHSRNEAEAYLLMIDALKSEINIKDASLKEAETVIAQFQLENKRILDSLNRVEGALNEALAMINDSRHQESLEKKVEDLTRNLRLAEGDLCYAAAQRAEEAADKVRFAPARKKEYLMEALEVYKKAFYLGKKEAAQDISKLEKSLLPTLATVR